jgi:hypothetical protein
MQLMALDLVGKRVELLKEIAPSIKRLAVIASPNHPGVHRERDVSVTAAKQLGLSVAYYPVKDQQELDTGLAAAQAAGTDALVVFPDGVTNLGGSASQRLRSSTNCRPFPAGISMPVPEVLSPTVRTCVRPIVTATSTGF